MYLVVRVSKAYPRITNTAVQRERTQPLTEKKNLFFLKYFVFTCIPQNHKHRCAERKRDGEEMGGRGRRQSERGRGRERQRVGMRQECENARNASTQKLVAGLFCPE